MSEHNRICFHIEKTSKGFSNEYMINIGSYTIIIIITEGGVSSILYWSQKGCHIVLYVLFKGGRAVNFVHAYFLNSSTHTMNNDDDGASYVTS